MFHEISDILKGAISDLQGNERERKRAIRAFDRCRKQMKAINETGIFEVKALTRNTARIFRRCPDFS